MIKIGQLEKIDREITLGTNRRVLTRRTVWYHLLVFSTIVHHVVIYWLKTIDDLT